MQKNIDWTSQWEHHAPNFHNGLAHINLSLYGTSGILHLKPGAGFGDCSHPTTRLVLQLMANRVPGYTLIDIGCGSGILSLAGLLWGATRAVGIDIDEEALEHAKLNGQLNQLNNACFTTSLPEAIGDQPLIVMNMISSEQRAAWSSVPALHNSSCPVITSGILVTEREHYVKEMRQQRGWHFINELQEGEWLAFLFQQQ